MAPNILHLPNGQHLTVTPVFGGLYFKSNELTGHHAPFPPGWTVVLNSADDDDEQPRFATTEPTDPSDLVPTSSTPRPVPLAKKHMVHRFKRPTLHNDHLFISSISQPNNNDYKPVSSPTRQIAMMLWATLWWYFHQPAPDIHITNQLSAKTPDEGKPRGQWRININREGVFKSKVILPKLERMGLIATEESAVGADLDERAGEGWQNMFVSRKVFWQLDARIYLFTMAPTSAGSPFLSGSPYHSRPSSPSRGAAGDDRHHEMPAGTNAMTHALNPHISPGPFHSASHLPTYYPPPPPQYIMSNGAIHPIRPKPPRQGETFYTRYVPSVEQYLSFRVASTSTKPSLHKGPVASAPIIGTVKTSVSDTVLPTIASMNLESCDVDLLHNWMNNPRVSKFWGEDGPQSHQEEFLKASLRSKHSFPAIGCWDGTPFGYFEIYWIKEDNVAKFIPGEVGSWDRGIHCLVGEEEFRGPHRVRIWLSALVHYCWLADERTQVIMMEPRVDNDKLLKYGQEIGFYKQTELCLPHKQANLLKLRREAWEAPEL
ncbi:hypothetical protein FKW77_000401 [Venturia effusa]|uniref:Acyltransferase MbtK/IucB-like conserved domain-containing protein n=1 Tax=Venturia effusa TaxID=50376 RepID=A0A517LGC2_9PEZI|nr:hypothetical protein FKW77_000401 [Venturia effusa]